MRQSTMYELLKNNGFKIFTQLEKLEKDLEDIQRERTIIKTLNLFFKKEPDKVLEHDMYGTITFNHNLLSRKYYKELDIKESILLEEIKRERIKEKREEMKGKISIVPEVNSVEEEKGAEIISLY